MCSILGLFDLAHDPGAAGAARKLAVSLSARQRHRGPDWSGVFADERCVLAHERLAIVDPESGSQPLRSADGALALAVNGEIYNHRELAATLARPYEFQTASDCEVINALWREHAGDPDPGASLCRRLNGIFAFALWDAAQGRYLIARDALGIIPLYYGRDERGQLVVASEMKALVGVCPSFEEFPPGHVLDSALGHPVRWFAPAWRDRATTVGVAPDLAELRAAFERAVHRQLMSDVPYGVLLSGGLDSSLVAACAARFAPNRVEDDDRSPAWWPRLHSFAIGLEGSPDVAAAKRVADFLGTAHHSFRYTIEEGIDALADVVRHVETYDVTSIRASTPMYLMARKIRAMGVKMVLSGEGSDEIFGGYLYFHKAPSPEAFHDETVRKLDLLHAYDLRRANKSMAAWGVEARVPFLDRDFLDLAMSFDAAHKMARDGRMEKHVLRQAFDGALPSEILWRQKEQFSDGVGYGWIDSLKAHAEREVSDSDLARAKWRFPINPPATKEAYLYRRIFDEQFPGESAARTVAGGPSVACSTPAAIEWDAAFAQNADPSGRAVAVHQRAL